MNVITSENADQALYKGLSAAVHAHYEGRATITDSRNGRVLRFNEPVSSVYTKHDITLFNSVRDSNPFFSVFESLWMLAGRNDTRFVTAFVKNMQNYSDDGETLNGAYGHRWRKHFGFDQIQWAIDELSKDSGSRRVNVQMWDGFRDPQLLRTIGSLDVPCNTNLYLEIQNDTLNMMVSNRSNDLVWGAYGANIVHFSIFQQYVAQALNCEVGTYTQVSRNAHIYLDNPVTARLMVETDNGFMLSDEYREENERVEAGYTSGGIPRQMPITNDHELFNQDINALFNQFDEDGRYWDIEYETDFMHNVVNTLGIAHYLHKSGDKKQALEILETALNLTPNPWLINAHQWIKRRM